jgi:phosphoribosylformylglycinamidine synthase
MLIKPESLPIIEKICARERCPFSVLGSINGSGRVTVRDPDAPPGTPTPEDLDLEAVLGDVPKKKYDLKRDAPLNSKFVMPAGETVGSALDRVLLLPSVCSKRFLTTKVDRSVTGLIAQQQCVGPLQIPLSDVGVISQTHFGITGGATSIGEAPLKGLVDPRSMARVSLGESLTNMVFANTQGMDYVKYSGNWMYAAKLGGDGAHMYDACEALCETMKKLGVAIDGGKDSLSMAAKTGGEVVKTPGTLVMSGYVGVPDITKTVTPDLKLPGTGKLILVEFGSKDGKRRIGGSALAQAYAQVGDESPDLDDTAYFKAAWSATQKLVDGRKISAGHDVSDGGFITAVLEMAFPSTTAGVNVTLPGSDAISACFAEELAIILEVSPENESDVMAKYASAGVTARAIGQTTNDGKCTVSAGGAQCVSDSTASLRDKWEEMSFEFEKLQSSNATVAIEIQSDRCRCE